MQVRDRSVIIYRQPDVSFYSEKRRDNMLLVRQRRYSGKMTGCARKRITKAITLMAMASPKTWQTNPTTGKQYLHHLSFCTLTVSDTRLINHRTAYHELLAPFLSWLRETKEVKAYAWKAELQKRGQIHYHLVFPKWIDHKELRKKWNYLQHKAGILEGFAREYGHYNPPSTEIKSKYSSDVKYLVKDVIEEMAKTVDAWELQIKQDIDQEVAQGTMDFGTVDPEYCYKLEVRERLEKRVSIEGKTWDCSNNLSAATYYTVDLCDYHYDAMENMSDDLIIKSDDWFCIITFKGAGPPGILSESEQAGLRMHLQSILN